MKVGIMGGTFDPIHIGHLIAAEAACWGAKLDEVWFMPSNVPPHKPNAPKATAAQRMEMVRLAISGCRQYRAIDIEIARGGTSYTVDTMALLRSEHPKIGFSYIIGADMVMYLPKWHRIGELIRDVSFIGLQRPGYELSLDKLPEAFGSRVTIVPMIQVDISSTDIRRRKNEGRPVRFLVADSVHDYMEGNGLYES